MHAAACAACGALESNRWATPKRLFSFFFYVLFVYPAANWLHEAVAYSRTKGLTYAISLLVAIAANKQVWAIAFGRSCLFANTRSIASRASSSMKVQLVHGITRDGRWNQEDDALRVLVVVAPEGSDLVLATDIPHREGDVLVLDRLDVEADSRDSRDNLRA